MYDDNSLIDKSPINGCGYTPDDSTFGYRIRVLISGEVGPVDPRHQWTFDDLQDGILSITPWLCDDGY